jgi:putative N6-adenine-specific DNA methylase
MDTFSFFPLGTLLSTSASDPIRSACASLGRMPLASFSALAAAAASRVAGGGSSAGDALERHAPQLPEGMPGSILMNPPYGERIEVRGKAAMSRDARGSEELDGGDDFFPRLAAHWKRQYTENPAGWTAWMLSPDMKLPSKMRLKESRRVPMWNGPIECRLFRFDLVKGSARKPAEGDAPA